MLGHFSAAFFFFYCGFQRGVVVSAILSFHEVVGGLSLDIGTSGS